MKPPKKNAPHAGHRLVTRRDFLAQGLIQSTAFALTPTILGTLIRSEAARAAGLCDAGGTGSVMPAVLIIDHAGGAGLLGQVLPRAYGDQPLTAAGYSKLGYSAAKAPVGSIGSMIDASWGIPFHKELSIATTLNSTLAALPALPASLSGIGSSKALTNGFFTVARLSDDTSNNMVNPAAGLALLGAIGDSDRKLASVVGTKASASGGNSLPSVSSPLFSATRISTANEAANLISTGQLAARLGNDRGLASKVISAMQRMSQGQLSRFSSQDLPTQAAELVQCGYLKASAMTGTPQPGLPSVDLGATTPQAATVKSIFDFANANEQRAGTMTYLLAMGFSGVATIELGGRDYHGSARNVTDGRDAESARITAKAIELFHRLVKDPASGARSRPLMVIHITDGGVSTGGNDDGTVPGFFQWNSDRGDANAAYVFMYDPAGKPQVARNQLGWANENNGAVEQDTTRRKYAITPFTNNAVALSELFMINYLQLAGRSPGEISKAFATRLSAADIATYAITAKARS